MEKIKIFKKNLVIGEKSFDVTVTLDQLDDKCKAELIENSDEKFRFYVSRHVIQAALMEAISELEDMAYQYATKPDYDLLYATLGERGFCEVSEIQTDIIFDDELEG